MVSHCPGGQWCTCCWEGCDCGCIDDCPVYRAAQKKERENIRNVLRRLAERECGSDSP